MATATQEQLEVVQQHAEEFGSSPQGYDSLLDLIGDARFVLLGEATHGTHEFYKIRSDITKRLIQEKGFAIIAWEADWPDAARVHRFVQDRSTDQTALEALGGFQRFPRWMWRNADILDLVGWLRSYNETVSRSRPRAGVYGLDLYSLHNSIAAVVSYLDQHDPAAAKEARNRYSCFEDFGDDPQAYGITAGLHGALSCEEEVVQQLMALQSKSAELLSRDGRVAADELFFAKQNAIVAHEAERYYRALYRGRPNTWNLRDTHMVETLERLMEHLEAQDEQPKAIVWAHNSHLGNARFTSMSQRGEVNIGQLLRDRFGPKVFALGFTTHTGTVAAADDWDGPVFRKQIRPSLDGSYERLFHESSLPRFLLHLRNEPVRNALSKDLLQRAIGVIYRPETERVSHYFYARLARQFDAVIHVDQSRAVEPLDLTPGWSGDELPETFPTGT